MAYEYRESKLQQEMVKWFKFRWPDLVLFAVPNGGTRRIQEAVVMKREGVMRGVSDLILLHPNGKYHGLCLEVKTPKGVQSDVQKIFMLKVRKFGYKYEIVRSLAEFEQEVENYLKACI